MQRFITIILILHRYKKVINQNNSGAPVHLYLHQKFFLQVF